MNQDAIREWKKARQTIFRGILASVGILIIAVFLSPAIYIIARVITKAVLAGP